jgi:hypothetical protein
MGVGAGMLVVETIAEIRRAYFVQKKPIKAICREYRLSRKVVRKVIRSHRLPQADLCDDRAVAGRPRCLDDRV